MIYTSLYLLQPACQSPNNSISDPNSSMPLRSSLASGSCLSVCDAPACSLSQTLNACPSLLPKSFKTHTQEEEEKVERGLRGEKGAVQLWREVIFFPFISPPLFPLTSPSIPISCCLPPPSPSFHFCFPAFVRLSSGQRAAALPVRLSAFPRKRPATGAEIVSICPRINHAPVRTVGGIRLRSNMVEVGEREEESDQGALPDEWSSAEFRRKSFDLCYPCQRGES